MTIRVGRWLSRNGGGLEILSIGPGAHFTGRYQTKVGKPDPNAWFETHGMTDGALVPGLYGFEVDTRSDNGNEPAGLLEIGGGRGEVSTGGLGSG